MQLHLPMQQQACISPRTRHSHRQRGEFSPPYTVPPRASSLNPPLMQHCKCLNLNVCSLFWLAAATRRWNNSGYCAASRAWACRGGRPNSSHDLLLLLHLQGTSNCLTIHFPLPHHSLDLLTVLPLQWPVLHWWLRYGIDLCSCFHSGSLFSQRELEIFSWNPWMPTALAPWRWLTLHSWFSSQVLSSRLPVHVFVNLFRSQCWFKCRLSDLNFGASCNQRSRRHQGEVCVL
jgi:hypothetical protein